MCVCVPFYSGNDIQIRLWTFTSHTSLCTDLYQQFCRGLFVRRYLSWPIAKHCVCVVVDTYFICASPKDMKIYFIHLHTYFKFNDKWFHHTLAFLFRKYFCHIKHLNLCKQNIFSINKFWNHWRFKAIDSTAYPWRNFYEYLKFLKYTLA